MRRRRRAAEKELGDRPLSRLSRFPMSLMRFVALDENRGFNENKVGVVTGQIIFVDVYLRKFQRWMREKPDTSNGSYNKNIWANYRKKAS